MFKMLNKKGFTLVELMIVVVILGILVAIAVPIYSAVTTNAKKKTCLSNMRIMSGIAVQYFINNDGYEGLFGGGTTIADMNAKTDWPEDFIGRLDNGKIPECPSDGTYSLTLIDANHIQFECTEHGIAGT